MILVVQKALWKYQTRSHQMAKTFSFFLFICMHAHKALNNKMWSSLKITELEIWSVCMETGRADFVNSC